MGLLVPLKVDSDDRSLYFVIIETTTNTTDLKVVFQVTVSGGFKVTPR